MDVRAVLAEVAELGPYFTIGTGPPQRGERPVSDLGEDPQPLRDRIEHVRHALGSDQRVAASLAFQGLAAQVVSAPYAAAVLHGVVPVLAPTLRWWAAGDGGWRMRCDSDSTALAEPDTLASLLLDGLAPLVTAVRAQVAVSERLLWGNAASAVAAAKRLVAMQRPAAAGRAADVAQALLGTGALAGAGELVAPHEPDRHWSFRRRSCCLYYRVPGGGGVCDDCVLLRRRS